MLSRKVVSLNCLLVFKQLSSLAVNFICIMLMLLLYSSCPSLWATAVAIHENFLALYIRMKCLLKLWHLSHCWLTSWHPEVPETSDMVALRALFLLQPVTIKPFTFYSPCRDITETKAPFFQKVICFQNIR